MGKVAVVWMVYVIILAASSRGEEETLSEKREKDDSASESKIQTTAVFAPQKISSGQHGREKSPGVDEEQQQHPEKSESQVRHMAVLQVQEIHDEKDEEQQQQHHADVPQSYKFGYEVKDEYDGHQFRHEQKDPHGTIHGRFGYRDPKGQYRQVDYVADDHGFRANVQTNEHGVENQDPADVDIQKETGHNQPEPQGHDYKSTHSEESTEDELNSDKYVPYNPKQENIESHTGSEEHSDGEPHHYGNQRVSATGHYPITLRPKEIHSEYERGSHQRIQTPHPKGGRLETPAKKGTSAVVYRHFYKQHLTHHQHQIQHPRTKYNDGSPRSVQYQQLSRGNIAKVVTSLPVTELHSTRASSGVSSHGINDHTLRYPSHHYQKSSERYFPAHEVHHDLYHKQEKQEIEKDEYEKYNNPSQEINIEHGSHNNVQGHQYQNHQRQLYHEVPQPEEKLQQHTQYEENINPHQYENNESPPKNVHAIRYKGNPAVVHSASDHHREAPNRPEQHQVHRVILKIPLSNYGAQEADLQRHYGQSNSAGHGEVRGSHEDYGPHRNSQDNTPYLRERVNFPLAAQQGAYENIHHVETPSQQAELYEVSNENPSKDQKIQTYKTFHVPNDLPHHLRQQIPIKNVRSNAHQVQYSHVADSKGQPHGISEYEPAIENPKLQDQGYALSHEQQPVLPYKGTEYESKLKTQIEQQIQPYAREPLGNSHGHGEYQRTIELDPEIYNQLINADPSKGHRVIAIPVLKQLESGRGHKLLLVGSPQHFPQNEPGGKSEVVVEEVPVLVPSGQHFSHVQEKHGSNVILPQGQQSGANVIYNQKSEHGSAPGHGNQYTGGSATYHSSNAGKTSSRLSLTPIYSKNIGSSHHLQIFLNPHAHGLTEKPLYSNSYSLANGRNDDSGAKSKWIPIPGPKTQRGRQRLPAAGLHYNTHDSPLSTGYSRNVKVIVDGDGRSKSGREHPASIHQQRVSRSSPIAFGPYDGGQGLHGQISYASSYKIVTKKNCNCKLKNGKLVPKQS